MSLSNKLRDAEARGAQAAHAGAERVRAGIHTVEENLRKLRKSYRAKSAKQPVSVHADPEQDRESPARQVRTGIVSVNGRDVGEMRCTGGRH